MSQASDTWSGQNQQEREREGDVTCTRPPLNCVAFAAIWCRVGASRARASTSESSGAADAACVSAHTKHAPMPEAEPETDPEPEAEPDAEVDEWPWRVAGE